MSKGALRSIFVITNVLTILALVHLTATNYASAGGRRSDVSEALIDSREDSESLIDQEPVEHDSVGEEGACTRDRCDEVIDGDNDWSVFDANEDSRDIIHRLSSYESLCNVERRSLSGDLSYKEFLHRYAYKEPVILTGASDNTRLRALTTRKRLEGDYGKSIVKLSTANTHSYDKGEELLFRS